MVTRNQHPVEVTIHHSFVPGTASVIIPAPILMCCAAAPAAAAAAVAVVAAVALLHHIIRGAW